MKQITIAGFLLLLFVAQLGSRFLVMLDFNLNRDWIANTLCENKSKPQFKCNGKCYLKKQLKKADMPEAAGKGESKHSRDYSEVIFAPPAALHSWSNKCGDALCSVKVIRPVSADLQDGVYHTPFQPPRA